MIKSLTSIESKFKDIEEITKLHPAKILFLSSFKFWPWSKIINTKHFDINEDEYKYYRDNTLNRVLDVFNIGDFSILLPGNYVNLYNLLYNLEVETLYKIIVNIQGVNAFTVMNEDMPESKPEASEVISKLYNLANKDIDTIIYYDIIAYVYLKKNGGKEWWREMK